MNRRSRRRQRRWRRLTVARGHIGQRLRCVRGVQRVREKHGVVHRAAQFDAHFAENVKGELPVVNALGDGSVFEKCTQFGRERQTQCASGIGADSQTEVGLFLSGLSDVKQ